MISGGVFFMLGDFSWIHFYMITVTKDCQLEKFVF